VLLSVTVTLCRRLVRFSLVACTTRSTVAHGPTAHNPRATPSRATNHPPRAGAIVVEQRERVDERLQVLSQAAAPGAVARPSPPVAARAGQLRTARPPAQDPPLKLSAAPAPPATQRASPRPFAPLITTPIPHSSTTIGCCARLPAPLPFPFRRRRPLLSSSKLAQTRTLLTRHLCATPPPWTSFKATANRRCDKPPPPRADMTARRATRSTIPPTAVTMVCLRPRHHPPPPAHDTTLC
jgi:hypothetical protein